MVEPRRGAGNRGNAGGNDNSTVPHQHVATNHITLQHEHAEPDDTTVPHDLFPSPPRQYSVHFWINPFFSNIGYFGSLGVYRFAPDTCLIFSYSLLVTLRTEKIIRAKVVHWWGTEPAPLATQAKLSSLSYQCIQSLALQSNFGHSVFDVCDFFSNRSQGSLTIMVFFVANANLKANIYTPFSGFPNYDTSRYTVNPHITYPSGFLSQYCGGLMDTVVLPRVFQVPNTNPPSSLLLNRNSTDMNGKIVEICILSHSSLSSRKRWFAFDSYSIRLQFLQYIFCTIHLLVSESMWVFLIVT